MSQPSEVRISHPVRLDDLTADDCAVAGGHACHERRVRGGEGELDGVIIQSLDGLDAAEVAGAGAERTDIAVLGLAAIAETFHAAFVVIKWLGGAYLLTLLVREARSRS